MKKYIDYKNDVCYSNNRKGVIFMLSIKDEISKNILFYRKKNNLTQKDLAEKLGVKHNAVSSWESGTNSVDTEIIFKLCDIFDISLNDIYGVKNDSNSIPAEHKDLIKSYSRLDPHGKEIVDATLNIEIKRIDDEQRKQEERLKAQEAAKKKAAKKIVEMPETKEWVLPSYDISASAGTGTIFDESECTPIVLKSEPPHGAAFVIPITGDSMTPKFHDGDYVFVRPQPTIEIGQIGIFYHDGSSYIKQLGNDELVSLNPEYPNIKIDEYTHCFGRVLGVYKPDSDAENEDDYEYYRIARSTTKPGETEKLTKNVLDNLEQKTKNGDFKRDYKF